MYLNASTDSIEIILGGTVTANQLQWNVSYQDITSSGMTLPQSAGAGLTNNATLVTMVAAPVALTTRQVTNINVYNADTATATVTIRKDVSGTKYVLMRITLTTLDVLMWSRENGWRLMSATGGGTTYTFSTGLTNTSGTVTANLSTGVSGGQSVIGGTAASNNLTLSSTTNATKGKILFGTSAYDEVNNRLGIGTANPAYPIDIVGDTFGSGHFLLNSALPNRHTQTVGFKGFWPGANSSFMASTATGFEGFVLNSNLVRQTTNWYNQDTARAAWQIYCGYGSSGEAFQILRAAATSGVSSLVQYLNIAGSTGNLTIGTGADAGFRLDVNGTARFQGNVTLNTKDIITDTTTGTKIATGTTQKLGFWNAAPIAQPTTAVAAATRVGGGGTTLTDSDTFDGYTLAQVVKALRNAGLLA